jgi:N4-gp56 family major capsid protein
MATQTYSLEAARIDKVAGKILKHAIPVEVLGITGDNLKHKKNSSKTVIYRRWLPYGGSSGTAASINTITVDPNSHLTQEGVTPYADTITPDDVTVVMNQYSCLYMYTDQTADLYEDQIPPAMIEQTGERMGLLKEMITYGVLKGCTNKFYAGGTSRSTVDETISLSLIRKIVRSIDTNRGKRITKVLSASQNYNTSSVEAGYIVFIHSHMASDVRDLPGFLECASYGAQKSMVHERELGAVEEFRFVSSPELGPIIDSGAAVGTDGFISTGAANNDVYPCIVVAKDAWANVALRGLDAVDPIHLPHNKKDKSDPLGQRGYIGASFYCQPFIQNDGWMAVAECAATDL